MRAVIGFFGLVEFRGAIERTGGGVRIQGSATISLEKLNAMLDDLINVIVRVIAGTSDPDSSIVAKALKILFTPLKLLKRGTLYYDNQAGSMGIELVLDIFGERNLAFSLPTPVRRRQLSLAGEEMADWPHPDDTRLNATRRRALSSTCGGPPQMPFDVSAVVDQVASAFSNLVAMARRIAPIDTSFEFEARGMLNFGISGYVRFQLARSGAMVIELGASLQFLGILIEGNCVLSTTGGIVSGRLYGRGTTPKLCPFCPTLHGALEVIKLPPERGSHVSVAMELEMTFACFEVRGDARMDTAGGLTYFLLEATNPMCFADLLVGAIMEIVPGAEDLLGAAFQVQINGVKILYDAGAFSIDVSIRMFEQQKRLTFNLNRPIESMSDLLTIIMDNALVILDALDDVFNVFSLTFFDVTVGHPEIKWDAQFGLGNWFNTGKGVEANGGLQLVNGAWSRVGFFGGGFGFNMDNYAYAGGNAMGNNFELFRIELAMQLDATFRNPIATDIAEGISDALNAIGLQDALNGIGRGSVNKDSIEDVIVIRNAACNLKEKLRVLLDSLTAQLGAMSHPQRNRIGQSLPTLIGSMDQIMIGVLETLGRGDTVKLATGSRVGLGSLRDLLNTFATSSSSFFTGSGVATSMSGVASAARSMRTTNLDMVGNLRNVPMRLRTVIKAINILILILTNDDNIAQLLALSAWGVTMRNMECSLRKTPELANRIAAFDTEVAGGVFERVSRLGHLFVAAQPTPLSSVVECVSCAAAGAATISPNATIAARSHFVYFDGLCERVRRSLARLVELVPPTLMHIFTEFKRAVAARRFTRAATMLGRSYLCAAELPETRMSDVVSFCVDAIDTLTAGCVVGPKWVEQPTWQRAVGTVSLVRVLEASDDVTLELDITLNVSARAQCSSTAFALASSILVQRGVLMSFRNNSIPSYALAMTTVQAMRIRRDGQLIIPPGDLERWWDSYAPLFVDASALDGANMPARAVCAPVPLATLNTTNATNASVVATLTVDHFEQTIDLTDASQPLVLAQRSPPTQTLLAGGLSLRPWPLVIANTACQSRCTTGLTLQSVDNQLPAGPSLSTIPWSLAACLQHLRRDYAECGVAKATADVRFATCVGAPPAALRAWLSDQLTGSAANESAIAMGYLDCESFTAAKAQHCTCVRTTGAHDAAVRGMEASVGIMYDPRAINRPDDLVTVRERLWGLGYGRASFSSAPPADSCDANLPVVDDASMADATAASLARGFIDVGLQERLTRVFLCAAAGEPAFEDPCDVARVNGNCAVGGRECPRLARTTRETCLRLWLPCANGVILPSSEEHAWLRAANAPGWTALPPRGEGFELDAASDSFAFGTTWLYEALLNAGRRLMVNSTSAPVLHVNSASAREGGLIPNTYGQQTGLELLFQMPRSGNEIDWDAVRLHVEALGTAGFGTIKLRGRGEGPTCNWRPSLCSRSRARPGTMIARLSEPILASQALIPFIQNANLSLAADNRSATLTIDGTNFGTSIEDVLLVAIGDRDCALLAFSTTALLANCTVSGRGALISGRPSVTTASAGRGIAMIAVATFIKPLIASPSQAPSLPSPPSPPATPAHLSFTFPRVRPYQEPELALDGIGSLEAPLGLQEYRRLQSTLRGELPACPVARTTSRSHIAVLHLAPAPPQLAAPSLRALQESSGAFVLASTQSITNRTAMFADGICIHNVAKDRFESCPVSLLSQHFPFAANPNTTLLGQAFGSGTSGGDATAYASSCSNDTFSYFGELSVPTPDLARKVPFVATLPAVSGANGLPDGLAVTIGPLALQNTTAVVGVDTSAVNGSVYIELTTVAIGQITAGCAGVSMHSFLDIWMVESEVAVHTILSAVLGLSVPSYDELVSSFRRPHVVLVSHGSVEGSPMDASIPSRLRGKPSGVHVRGDAELKGAAGDLLCLMSWMRAAVHPCRSNTVEVEVYVPSRAGSTFALGAANMTVALANVPDPTPTVIASLGSALLSVDDLQPIAISPWGQALTQRPSLRVSSVTVRLPTRADCSSWIELGALGAVVALRGEEKLSEAQLARLMESAPGLAPPTSNVHRYIELVDSGGGMPAVPGSWFPPVGMAVVLSGVRFRIAYTTAHPIPLLEGPMLHVTGSFSLAGNSITVGVQLDRRLATSVTALQDAAVQTGVYLASSAELSIRNLMNIYLMMSPGLLATATTQLATMPLALGQISTSSFFVTLATSPMYFGGGANHGFGHLELQPGFHGEFAGSAWGGPALLTMHADVNATSSLTSYDLSHASLGVNLLEPSTMDHHVRQGLQMAIGMGAGSFVNSCNTTRGEASFALGEPLAEGMSGALLLSLAGVCAHQHLTIHMSLNVSMANNLTEMNDRNVSQIIAESWPSPMAFRIQTPIPTTIYDLIRTFFMLGDAALGRGRVAISRIFNYIRAPGVDACIAAADTPRYCNAGAHAAIPIAAEGGPFGLAADAYFTSTVLNGQFSPLLLDVVIKAASVGTMTPYVIDGILSAMPSSYFAGAARYLSGFVVTAARFHYMADLADASSSQLILTLESDDVCERRVVMVPLSLFEPLADVNGELLAMHVQQALGRMPHVTLLAFFTSRADLRVDFIAETDVPRMVNDSLLTSGSLASHLSHADVCQLGMYVHLLELAPPKQPSEMCRAVWLWMERADGLRQAIADDASCGHTPASAAWARLADFEARLRDVPPQAWMIKCMQTGDFLSGFRVSAAIPATSLSRQLGDLERVLTGMEAAWLAEDDAEINELTPYAVSALRTLDEWQPVAQHIAEITESVGGVLRGADEVGPTSVVAQLSSWGQVLQAVIGTQRSMPDPSNVLGRVRAQILVILPRVQRVADAMATIAAQVDTMVQTLASMEREVAALRPQAAFSALAGLAAIEDIDFRLITDLLDASQDFLQNGQNLLSTMTSHRSNVDAWSFGGPINVLRREIQTLQETIARRRTSATGELTAFPEVVESVMGTLVGRVQETAQSLGRCATVVSSQSKQLQAFLAEADTVATGPAAHVDRLAKAFFRRVGLLTGSANEFLASIATLRSGEAITNSMRNASRGFTPRAYEALGQETTKLYQFFRNFATQVVTPDLSGMVTFIGSLLRPALTHIHALVSLIEVRPYFEHMLALPTTLLTRLLSFSTVLSSTPAFEALVSATVGTVTTRVFGATSHLQVDLAELTAPSSMCDVDCVIDLQLRVRTMKQHVRELRRQLGTVAALPTLLQNAMLTSIDQAELATELLPDLHVLSTWSRGLTGRVPNEPAAPAPVNTGWCGPEDALLRTSMYPACVDECRLDYLCSHVRWIAASSRCDMMSFCSTNNNDPNWRYTQVSRPRPRIVQQLEYTLCNELALKRAQGRDATPPAFFANVSCAGVDALLEDVSPNPTLFALEGAAEAAPLFSRLVDAMRSFTTDLESNEGLILTLIASADGQALALSQQADAFTGAFTGIATHFGGITSYVSAAADIFTLRGHIRLLDDEVAAVTTTIALRHLSESTTAALRRANEASAPPFECANVPQDCEAVSNSANPIDASAAELAYAQSLPGDNVAVTLLTGVGDGTCFLRAGVEHVRQLLETLTQPLEKLVELFIQGPSALKGDVPACEEDDLYCMATVSRSTAIYRYTTFPIFYLHFWSLGAPPTSNPCRFVMTTRFTIPGLWSSSAMQSSTLLGHNVKQRFAAQCARYTHLLGYAPAVPGGCTASYQSFMATADPHGMVHTIHQIITPSGAKYAGSMSGLAVSHDLGTVWVCGKEYDQADYSLMSFKLSDLNVGFGAAGLTYNTRTVRMCSMKTIIGYRGTAGKERCNLAWDKKKQWLWVGNTAQAGETGRAQAFTTTQASCPGGGTVFNANSYSVFAMSYGEHVSSFSFLTDMLGDDYVSLARCDIFDRKAKTKPCKIEFHEVGRNREGARSLGSPTLGIRTPAGLGNLVSDTSLGVTPYNGGYFQASFVGMTSEHADETESGGGEPEDRVFVFRTPFLKTGVRKSVDRASLRVGGVDIVPGVEILQFLPLNPSEPELEIQRRRAESTVDDETMASDAAKDMRHAVAMPGNRRRLWVFKVLSVSPPSICQNGVCVQMVRTPDRCNANLLYPMPDNAEDFAFQGCMGGTFYLVQWGSGRGNQDGQGFSYGVGEIGISGSLSVTPRLVVGMTFNLCLEAMKLRIGVDIQTGLKARLDISAEFASIAKGWIRIDGSALGLVLKPMMIADIKRGKIGGRFDLGLTIIDLEVRAGLTTATIHFCKQCGPWNCCCFHYPCGWGWGNENSWKLFDIRFGTGGTRNILNTMGDDGDRTPPVLGKVEIKQIGPNHVAVNFAGFREEESDILSTEMTIRLKTSYGKIFYCEANGGTSESWSGPLDETPNHNEEVIVCAKVRNSYNKLATKCSAPMIWDARPPEITAFYTVNPFSGHWRMANPLCSSPLAQFMGDQCKLFTNATDRIKFGFRLTEVPNTPYRPVKSALWAISTGGRCTTLACPEGTLVAPFSPIGHAERLMKGTLGQYYNTDLRRWRPYPLLDVLGKGLNLINGAEHFFNLHLCDQFDNCAVRSPKFGLYVDMTPPIAPMRIISDRHRKSSIDGTYQYFVSETRIDPMWIFGSYDLAARPRTSPRIATSDDFVDPESGAVFAHVDLYRLRPGDSQGREHSGRYVIHKGYPQLNLQAPSYLHANTQEHGLRLLLGARYMLELVQTNVAGGRSVTPSETIVADWTTPVCTTPLLAPGPNEPMVRAMFQPVGSTSYGGTRVHSWVHESTSRISVQISDGVCQDAESGIQRIQMWVGSKRNAHGDIVAKRDVQAGSVVTLDVRPLLDFQDRTECDRCGSDTVVGIECTNGAAQRKVCQRYASFRVDGSPPTCKEDFVLLGDGAQRGFQSSTHTLKMSNFDYALEDRETGIERVEYTLIDEEAVPTASRRTLSADLRLPLVDHDGLPTNRMAIPGLSLEHGHTYAIEFRAKNYVGLVSAPCRTSSVLIDTTPPLAGPVVVLQHDSQNEAASPEPNYYQYSLTVMRIATRNFTDPESEILGFYATVFRESDGWVMQPAVWLGPTEFITLSVELEDKQRFYVEWRAVNKAQLSTSVNSTVVTVDATAPMIDYVRDSFGAGVLHLGGADADVVGATELEIGTLFTARDTESGIRSVSWCLGTFPGACDVIQPVDVEHQLLETVQSVRALIDRVTYYALINVINNAGNWQAMVADGFTVDVSAPECAQVFDGPGYDRRFVGPTVARANDVQGDNDVVETVGELLLSWVGFSDFYSGIGGYAAAMVPSSMLGLANTSNTRFEAMGLAGSTSFLQVLEHAETYHGVVQVWDGLMNSRVCFSNGVMYDHTPPNVSLATLVSRLSLTGATNVQRVAHLVRAEVHGVFDPESGVRQYYAAVGDVGGAPEAHAIFRSIGTSEGEMLIGGLTLRDGEVLVTVRATNNAMEQSQVSMKIGVDTTPPSCTPIALWDHEPGQRFAYTEETSHIVATWNCTDAAPWAHAALQCEWAVASFPGGDDLMPWTAGRQRGTHNFSCIDCFENGRLYFVSVRCTDQVGLRNMSVSGGLMPDLNGPTVATPATVVTRYTGRATKFWGFPSDMMIVFGFDDRESGIKNIRGVLSDSSASPLSGPRDVDGLRALPLALPNRASQRQVLIPLAEQGVSLVHNGRYVLHVCAEDHMNHTTCSAPYDFLVDLTPPQCRPPDDRTAGLAAPSVFSRRAGFGAVWECRDFQSGVAFTSWMAYGNGAPLLTRYVRMLGGESGGQLYWRGYGARSITIPYVDGMHFSSCVSATNNAELYSLDTCSNGALFDGSAPQISGGLIDEAGAMYQRTSTTLCTALPIFYENTSGASAGLDPPNSGSSHPCCPPCLLTERSLDRHRAPQRLLSRFSR